jgi:hypothetical protein
VKVITLIDDPFLEIARVVSALRSIRASLRHCGCGYLSGGSDGGARDEVTSHDRNGRAVDGVVLGDSCSFNQAILHGSQVHNKGSKSRVQKE